MPVQAYLVLQNQSGNAGLLNSFWRTSEEAIAAASTDAALSALSAASSVPDDVVPGVFYDGTDFVIEGPLTTDQIVARRRNNLLALLRPLERIEGIGTWTAGELNGIGLEDFSTRAKSYARWVEMMTRATAIDANLSNDSRHAILLREASHPGRVWYWLHWSHGQQANGAQGMAWSGGTIFGSSRLGWSWYSSTGTDVFDTTVRIADADVLNPNTRGFITAAQVIDGAEAPSVNAGSDFNWVGYLA